MNINIHSSYGKLNNTNMIYFEPQIYTYHLSCKNFWLRSQVDYYVNNYCCLVFYMGHHINNICSSDKEKKKENHKVTFITNYCKITGQSSTREKPWIRKFLILIESWAVFRMYYFWRIKHRFMKNWCVSYRINVVS